ncbi:MAG TPA: thioredoxin family protein [Nevskiaceae bacterium]
MISRLLFALILVSAAALPVGAAAAEPGSSARTAHLQVSLLSENSALAAGQTNWLALELKPQRGWHTYWKNPGEAGQATNIRWQLPNGVTAGPITWPTPTQLETAGFIDYGYDTPTALLIPLQVAKDAAAGTTTLAAHVSWLVCKDICIPGDAELHLALPTTQGPARPNSVNAALFAAARARLPQAISGTHAAHYRVADGRFTVELQAADLPHGRAFFYPLTGALVDYSAPQYAVRGAQGWRVSTAQSRHFQAPAGDGVQGVLAITTRDGKVASYAIDAVPGAVEPVPISAATETRSVVAATSGGGGLLLALAFAILGGLILNLMPCVFPVLSIKAIGVVRAATLERREQRRQGLAYTAGVVLTCLVAAGALMALRAGGQALGWGFQLQSPVFVALLACLMFVLGLSLSGVFDFGSRWMGAGQTLTRGHGAQAAFFTGVLAVVVASPCTAPFMGTAMGYAMSQPTSHALAVFAALGVGLALPFLAISFVPRLAGWLPRPGPWMVTFKQLMAFPLYLTAVWLVWVLTRQAGADAAALVLAGMVVLGLVLWAHGRWPRLRRTRAAVALGAAAAVVLSLQAARFEIPVAAASGVQAASADAPAAAAQAWSPERVAELQAAGRTVFVDFTADWCLTCKVNERLALDSPAVRRAFAHDDVALLRADWTRRDPAITAALDHFGRAGVPLYVVYRPGQKARILPQLLTPGIVTAAVGS